MAYAGSIGTFGLNTIGTNRESQTWITVTSQKVEIIDSVGKLPSYAVSPVDAVLILIPRTGSISGQVQVNGIPSPYAIVYLYWKLSGELIEKQRCTVTGNFSFTELNSTVDNYMVAGKNPGSNDIVFTSIMAV